MAEVVAQLKEQVASQNKELEYARLKIQVLEERLRLVRIQKYGPSSEKLSNLQLELLEQEPGVSQEEVVAESERKAPPPVTEQKKRKHPGRQTLPANLPRVDFVREFLDSGDSIFNFFANFRRWRKLWISQPIMSHHPIFIRIGDGAGFECGHVGERFLHFRLHRREECVVHIHPAQIHGQSKFWKLSVILLKSRPPFQL